MGAREIAAEVLVRVWQEGAWAAPTLDAALRRAAQLDPRDRRLATELVHGVLRTTSLLERAVATHARSARWRNKALVRAHMCIAAYELLLLDKVPDFASVSQAVAAIKAASDPKVAGFANAVLRKIAKTSPRPNRSDAAVQSLPSWLRASLSELLGDDELAELVSGLEAPATCLCIGLDQDREHWLEQLATAVPEAAITLGTLSDRCLLLRGAGDTKRLPGFDQAWRVQEEGAQALTLAVGARPGETVLDACAGRGNKTLLLAELVGPEGAVDAADLHPRKLERLASSPVGRRARALHAIDWTRGSGTLEERYDRVLVDAPCSGVGTLRRRPEIASRLGASDIERLAALQRRILRQTAEHVRDGGRLIYAVCSLLPEECEQVVAAIVSDGPLRIEPIPFDSEIGARLAAGGTSFRLLPHVHHTDGYFAASFVVRRS